MYEHVNYKKPFLPRGLFIAKSVVAHYCIVMHRLPVM